jgi:hypothetical protein
MSAALYSLLFLLFHRSVLCFTDPLNLAILLLAAYFSGALFIVTIRATNKSFVDVLILNLLFAVAAAAFSRKPAPLQPLSLKGLRTGHLYFTCCFAGLLLVNLVVNQIFGIMPLFLGNEARQDLGTTAIPSLVLLAPDIGYVLLLIFLLTDSRVVKRASGIGLFIAGLSAILNGSKSAVVTTTVGLLFSADYVLHLKRVAVQPAASRQAVDMRIKKLRRWIVLTSIAVAILLPFYLVFVGAGAVGGGSAGAVEGFATRLFGGFDNLAFIAFNDLDITSAGDVNLSQYYFYPFYKKLLFTPDFQSAGEYIVYLATSDYDYSTHGLHPNSNFAIELLLQNGSVFISGLVIVVAAAILFTARRALISKHALSMLHIVLWASLVMAPLAVLFDGAYFIIKFYMLLAFYFLFNTILNCFKWMLRSSRVYSFF